MTRWLSLVRTALSLGLPNIARAVGYRLGVRLGWNPVRQLQGTVPVGPFFGPSRAGALTIPPVAEWQTSAQLFSRWPIALSHEPPDWLANPLTRQRMAAADRPWWQIPDFDPVVGDIKLIWELSRMDWVLALSQRVRLDEQGALDRLNAWLADWCAHNPPYQGPNWKCGQEASIRVMHLACAAMLLGQAKEAMPGLRQLVALHLQRIAPTVQYAMAQDNNHGTSEAAALFMGGSWLAALGDARGHRWAVSGRKLLENRAARLIGEQGTFSQYSLNYHRLMLDTLSIAECWRLALGLPAFSRAFQARALAATRWLHALSDPESGDGPNVGANDGARLLQLTNTDFRDHRPSVQLAMVLFAGKRAYVADGPWNHALQWLGVPLPPQTVPAASSLQADDGGVMVMRKGKTMALLRYPRFRFRPSQADALHLDLWLGGDNLLRDAGSFSYNTEPKWQNYFGGTASHNTVQFDERDQMSRLSRFLFADWLKTSFLEPITQDESALHFAAGYVDGHHASHRRRISLSDSHLRVVDEVAGFARKAVLRWRLAPGDWRLDGQRLTNSAQVLTVKASMPIVRFELVEGWESRHYLEKTPVPVLEIEVQQAGTLTTEYHWAA
jgi:hypothetical protein